MGTNCGSPGIVGVETLAQVDSLLWLAGWEGTVTLVSLRQACVWKLCREKSARNPFNVGFSKQWVGFFFSIIMFIWVWWQISLIPALLRQWQVDLCESQPILIYDLGQLGCIIRP